MKWQRGKKGKRRYSGHSEGVVFYLMLYARCSLYDPDGDDWKYKQDARTD